MLVHELAYHPSRYESPEDMAWGLVITEGISIDQFYPQAGDDDKSCGCKK
jgi:hypothetical protein